MRGLIALTLCVSCQQHVGDGVDWSRAHESGLLNAAAVPVDVDPSAHCASEFGDALTQGFGRLDGTLIAIVPPGHPSCPMPNPDHVVLQVKMQGQVYRVEVNTLADRGPNATVIMQAVEARSLEGPAFSEGWHTPLTLDYHDNFGMAPADLKAQPNVSDEIINWLEVGKPISIYAQSPGGTRSHTAHLVHRTSKGKDGAIVVNPNDAAPVYLIFAFAGQEF